MMLDWNQYREQLLKAIGDGAEHPGLRCQGSSYPVGGRLWQPTTLWGLSSACSRRSERGDLDGILETVHSDSRLIYVGANPKPTKAELVGHANVRRFFEAIIRRLELKAFESIEFVVQGDTVVVFGSESGALRTRERRSGTSGCTKYVVGTTT